MNPDSGQLASGADLPPNQPVFTANSLRRAGVGRWCRWCACLMPLLLLARGLQAQALTNGFDQTGTLVLNTTNLHTFYATNGDTVRLRMGAPGFRPLITLHAPNGATLGSGAGAGSASLDATLEVTINTNGIFGARVSSYYGTGSGDYVLCLARVPAPFELSPADAGGPLTNGAANAASIGLGDVDMWSFTAAAGSSIIVRMGTSGFRPHFTVYDPTGLALGTGAGSSSADTDAVVVAQASVTGTYTVVVQAFYANGTGPYTLHLAQAPGGFVVSAGDEGGLLVNGAWNFGQIVKGDLDLWQFEASAGDNLTLRVGSPGLRPWIRLYGPTGILVREGVGASSSDRDTAVSVTATNTGTHLVVVQSYYTSLSSPYTLSLARVPAAFVTSAGDEGGVLTSGLAHPGTNSLGDLDLWSFSANAGDNLALRMGSPDYRPLLSLYGPNGALIQTASGASSAHRDASIFVLATNSGVFTVVAQSYYNNGTGPYALSFGQFPGTHMVSPGDEGGPLTNAASQDATLALGDLDLWSFMACKGFSFTLICQKLSGVFTPRLRLYGRNGALLATTQNASTAILSYAGTNSGIYSLLIEGAGANDSGTYRLTALGIHEDALKLCPPILVGNTANLTGYGGTPGSTFALLTASDLTTPVASWQSLLTNQFDAFGAFDFASAINPAEPARFFRLRAP